MSDEVPVQVAVGIKQIPDEAERRSTLVTIKDFKSVTVSEQNTEGKEHTFTYDCVFQQDIDQERVYTALVKSLLSRVSQGYNASLLVSGTYTSSKRQLLAGDGREDGIVCKMLKDLFADIRSVEDHKQLITLSDMQFHLDGSTVDLLNPHNRGIYCLQHSVLGLVMAELSEMVASSFEEAWRLYREGTKVQELGGTPQDRCSTVNLEKKEPGTTCVRSSLRIFKLTGGPQGDPVNGVTPLADVLSENPTHRSLGTLLTEALRGNSCTTLIYCLTLPESWPGQTDSELILAQRAMGLTNQVSRRCWDYREVTQQLRSDISGLRKRASLTGDLCGPDVVKQQRWDKRQELSTQCKEERRQLLKAKGWLEHVPEPEATPSKGGHPPSQALSKLFQEHRQKSDQVSRIKEELKEQVAKYLKAGSWSADERPALLSSIQELRERLRMETENLRHVTEGLEALENVAELSPEGMVPVQSDLDRLYSEAQEKRMRLAESNAALMQQELLRMIQELELQQAGQCDPTAGPQEVARLRRERDLVVLQLVTVRREKEEAELHLRTMHQHYKVALVQQKLQASQDLHEFQEASQLQLNALEQRYRRLLQEAVQDAVHLSGQNQQQELQQRHQEEVIANLRHQLSVTRQWEENPCQRQEETERATASRVV